ncbi:unnamed protein product, partial [Didymodactylos carnosus]
YSWCSSRLINEEFRLKHDVELDDLIPLEPENNIDQVKLVIGHHVAFDRTFIKQQYQLMGSAMRFLDTMSLHIMCSGFTHTQRSQYQAFEKLSSLIDNDHDGDIDREQQLLDIMLQVSKEKQMKYRNKIEKEPNLQWKSESGLNNLVAVHKLYCKPEKPLNKDMQKIFIEGTIDDVRENFQKLMTYCGNDVKATCEVIKILYPMFVERFDHPVTLSGMLEMSTMFLPINQNWNHFIREADVTFENIESDMQHILMQIANETCKYAMKDAYRSDPWLWDLDWSTQNIRFSKSKTKKKTKSSSNSDAQISTSLGHEQSIFKGAENCWPTKITNNSDDSEIRISANVQRILDTHLTLLKIQPHMPGYPAWYRDLCAKMPKVSDLNQNDVEIDENVWQPGPQSISTKLRVVPKLLKLTWQGYPVHYNSKHGWGYLVPGKNEFNQEANIEKEKFIEEKEQSSTSTCQFPYKAFEEICKVTVPVITNEEVTQESKLIDMQISNLIEQICPTHQGNGPYDDVNIPGCWFFKIPHKDGNEKNVGNPLARSFGSKIADGTLQSYQSTAAAVLLQWSKMLSYWQNNEKRIKSQMPIWIKENDLPDHVAKLTKSDNQIGIILPRVVVAGTVTRRAVEPTWLTASNAQTDRIGSELKAMVQAPPGYCFVGADVDSQELWIASILADAQYAGMHGSTAFGWMNLQGKKKDGTDLHSKVANLVFNYGRIYGAGRRFAEKLLMQFNHSLSSKDAKEKARIMYENTKGIKDQTTGLWENGSESEMFNKLEQIAKLEKPVTPVLGCQISRALEPRTVSEEYMTSRINWVVQSSAVDYLHLMLVCMKWLTDKYRACLALQIANLFTRAMFAYKLNMNDLPASVAFFSSVDIDQCLRKEPLMDCKTPSNPLGLQASYGIPPGQALTIGDVLEHTNGSLEESQEDISIESKQEKTAVEI